MATRTTNRDYRRPEDADPARIEEAVGIPLDEIDADVQAIDDAKIDYGQGLLDERPASSREGVLFYATDDGQLYYDTGAGWVPAAWQPGDVKYTASSRSPPAGWARAEGQLLRIADYPALFDKLGTTHGGDGAATFGVPDLRGRAIVGAGAGGGLTNRALGSKFGTEAHRLTEAEVAEHDHPTGVGGQGFEISMTTLRHELALQPGSGIGFPQNEFAVPNTGNAGAGTPHNNMQPSIALYGLIKL